MIRWTPTRKAALLDALDGGWITRAEAEWAYGLGEAELAEWRRRDAAGGTAALAVKQSKFYRAKP